jgi:hypothetical protein
MGNSKDKINYIYNSSYGSLSPFLSSEISKYPLLSKEEELELGKIIATGNKQEAEEYAKAGLPYDGVDCLVYKDGSYKIRLKFICSKIEGTNNVGLVPTLTISKDLRGKTYKDLAASVSDSVLSARKLSPRIRAEIEIYRNKLNYLKYKHKMI